MAIQFSSYIGFCSWKFTVSASSRSDHWGWSNVHSQDITIFSTVACWIFEHNYGCERKPVKSPENHLSRTKWCRPKLEPCRPKINMNFRRQTWGFQFPESLCSPDLKTFLSNRFQIIKCTYNNWHCKRLSHEIAGVLLRISLVTGRSFFYNITRVLRMGDDGFRET